jgi:hypothetical protein
MARWLDGSMARWLAREKYFRTLEDIAHILVNDGVTIHLIDWIPGPAQETPTGNRNPGPRTQTASTGGAGCITKLVRQGS